MIRSEMLAPQDAPLYVLLLLVLAIFAVALFVLLRKRGGTGARSSASEAPAVRDATVVFHPDHRALGAGTRRAPATFTVSLPDDDGTYLVPLIDDDGTPGPPIRVQARSLYIGRDAARAQIVFADPSVSRLHARLVEEGDGVYMLHDEGSASGTFVNDERVDLQPRRLKSGDVIEFGRQRVIFESPDPIGDMAAVGSQG
jgi:hypothetical protein